MPWDWGLYIPLAAQAPAQKRLAVPVLILHSHFSVRTTSKTSILLLVQVPTLKKVLLTEAKVSPL